MGHDQGRLPASEPGGACYFQMSEEGRTRHRPPGAMIGSDGLPTTATRTRLWGAFRVLAPRGALAFHSKGGTQDDRLTARTFRIAERGLLKVGAMADVVVFDPARIADTATYDRPISASLGIGAVFVNGRLAYRGGPGEPQVLARAGRMLSRGDVKA
jgi:N-acyl-D-amino-acid deacylase